MKPAFFPRGLCAAALLLSLAACGGGSGTDAGALGATAASNPAPTAQKPDALGGRCLDGGQRLLASHELGSLTFPLFVLHIFELPP